MKPSQRTFFEHPHFRPAAAALSFDFITRALSRAPSGRARRAALVASLVIWTSVWAAGLRASPALRGEVVPSAGPAFSHLKAELDPDFAEAWRATVAVASETWRPGARVSEGSVGSGVILRLRADEAFIATSSHVVPCRGACVVEVGFASTGDERIWAKGSVLWRDRRQDVALLKVPVPEGGRPAAARRGKAPAHGAPVVALGFPDPELLRRRDGQAAPGRLLRHSSGVLVERRFELEAAYRSYGSKARRGRLQMRRSWLHSAPLLPGSSGGPLVDEEGAVIGLNTGSVAVGGEGRCFSEARGEGICLYLATPLDAAWQELARETEKALRADGAKGLERTAGEELRSRNRRSAWRRAPRRWPGRRGRPAVGGAVPASSIG